MRQGQADAVPQRREQRFRVQAVADNHLPVESLVAGIEPEILVLMAGVLLQPGGDSFGDGAPGQTLSTAPIIRGNVLCAE